MKSRLLASSPAFLLALCLGATAGCAPRMYVRSDYDRAQDFSRYATYAWMSDDPVISPKGETSQVSPLNRRRIVAAIESELAEKGMRKIEDRDAADFVVAYTVGARDKIDVQSYPAAYHGSWRWGWPYFGNEVDVHAYTEGTLAIDIFDGKTRQPVWHGRAQKRITAQDIEDAAGQIRAATSMILSEFPPG